MRSPAPFRNVMHGIDRRLAHGPYVDRLRALIRRSSREELDAFAAQRLPGLVDEAVQKSLAQSAPTSYATGLALGAGTRLDRTVEPGRMDRLAAEIRELTGQRADVRLVQAYRSLMELEARGYGRVAGWTYNVLGKLVVPPLLDPPAGPVLEIGTLYGLFSAGLIRQLRRDGTSRHLTVVDPLIGVQEQDGRAMAADPSGWPVARQIVELNFALSGLGADDYRIVQGYSTDADVRAEAGDRTYAVVIVDGDHSEQGVYRDLCWAETIVAPGGVVVMDDFGDAMWPGVQAGATRYLADGGTLELLGKASTSGYLRATR